MCITPTSGYSVDRKKSRQTWLGSFAKYHFTVSPNIALLVVLNFCDCAKNACTNYISRNHFIFHRLIPPQNVPKNIPCLPLLKVWTTKSWNFCNASSHPSLLLKLSHVHKNVRYEDGMKTALLGEPVNLLCVFSSFVWKTVCPICLHIIDHGGQTGMYCHQT